MKNTIRFSCVSRQIVPRRVSGVHGRSVHMQDEVTAAASVLFDQYCAARTFAAITSTFQQMCDVLELKPSDHHNFYHHLKARLTTWKAQSLWAKLDKRATQREYKKGKACANTRVSRRFLFTVVRTPQKILFVRQTNCTNMYTNKL